MKRILFVALSTILILLTMDTTEVHAASERVVTVPILLYHRVSDQNSEQNRYAVSVDDFEAQMEKLDYWGYETVSIEQIVDHIKKGSDLPPRPIVISFDDGYLDVFVNAYPIMERYGQTGSVFIVANRLNSAGFLQEKELEELIDNGWEVGSHSMTHTDLTLDHALARPEILQSRLNLENALGIKISSFAYPFGTNDWYVSRKVYDYGYQSAVGVGHISIHSFGTLYNLSRREVEGGTDLTHFADIVPWSNYFIPAPKSKYTPQ